MPGLLIALKEYGLIGIVVGVTFFMLWRMIVWVMAFIKDMTKQHAIERISWQNTINATNELISGLANSMEQHDKQASERGHYIREEHKEMIQCLGRINGYQK